jgi:hypothetical protein
MRKQINNSARAKTAKDVIDFDPNAFLATIGEGRKIVAVPKKQTIFTKVIGRTRFSMFRKAK